MAWERVPGLAGKVYVPEPFFEQPKKHPCPDCHACQMCGDDRCHLCRKRGGAACKNNTADG